MARIVGLTFDKPAAPVVFTCPHCDREYKTEDGLEKHMKKEHPETVDPSSPEE